MKAASLVLAAAVITAAAPRASDAQQFPMGPGPAALSVPHPIPPPVSTLPVPPRDLYQHLTPPPPVMIPTVVYAFVYGPSMNVGSTYFVGTRMVSTPAVPPALRIAQGGLRFESSPGSAQVYVDGRYVGVIDDFGLSGRALDLDEGVHRVELRGDGYATLSFDVCITANQTIRYRGDLRRPSAGATITTAIPSPKGRTRTPYLSPNSYAS